MACGVPHSIARQKINMSAIAQQAQVAKTVAVSTGKVANAKSMMVWRPHGNKYVRDDSTRRRRRRLRSPSSIFRDDLIITRRGISLGNFRDASVG